MFSGNEFNICFLTDLKLLLLSHTVFRELICALDVKNNKILLSWSLDLGQSKVKKLGKLYHAIADFQIQNFGTIWSNCLSLIIIYNSHEALKFFPLLILFYLKYFQTTDQRVQSGLYIKKVSVVVSHYTSFDQ